MPPNPSAEQAGLAALLGSQSFVPFVGVYTTCLFGQAVSAKLLSQSRPRLRQVFMCGGAKDATSLIEAVVAPAFPASIAPLILKQELPMWVVGFTSRAATDRSAVEMFLEGLSANYGLNTFRVLVYATDSLADLPTAGSADVIVVIGSGSLARFNEADSAAVVCAYLRSAWEDYCAAPQRNPQNSLHLPVGKYVWVGFGMDRPDFDYHRAHLAETLTSKVRTDWLADTSTPVEPGFSSATELCGAFLPDEYYHASAGADLPCVRVGAETVVLRPTEKIRPKEIVRTTTKREWPKQRSEVLQYEQLLRLTSLPAIEQYALAKTNPLAQSEHVKWLQTIRRPEKPTGLFAYLHEHFASAEKVTAAWKRSITLPHPDGRPLKENLAKVDAALLSLPSGRGLALRVGLIVVGLTWLTLGPVIWSGVVGVFTHPVLRWVAGGSLATAVVIIAGAAGNYIYARQRLERKLELAYTDLERTHLWEIGERVVKAFAALEIKVAAIVDIARKHLAEVTMLLRQPVATGIQGTNGAPHFDDTSTVAVLKSDLAELADRLHRKVTIPIWDQGIFANPAAQWVDILTARANEVAREALEEPTYGDWVQAAAVSATTLSIVSTTMKRFAEQAVTGTAGGHVGQHILIGPQAATKQIGGFTVVRDADLPFVCVVCPRQILNVPEEKKPNR